MKPFLQKYRWFYRLLPVALLVWFWFAVPRPLFDKSYTTVIESAEGQLLGARIAADGQWRFPQPDSIPEKFKKCLINFEDRWFYYHPGINPVALIRALVLNIKQGKIVSGGSTLTMQVCRITRGNKRRSVYNKLAEMIWALNLELRFSKSEILNLYASNAPFGGNVVGLEAASWRYFNRPPQKLSWAEAATLAVLPNAPSLIYPGKRDLQLQKKRDRLLKKLFEREVIDELTYELSVLEPLPDRVYPLPSRSSHLLELAVKNHKGKRVKTTVDPTLQERVSDIVLNHFQILRANYVHNLAVVVADVETGNVLAYVGNIPDLVDTEHGNYMDVIQSPRSTGSILKPFLFAVMMENGKLNPTMLLPDIPTRIGSFTPENFDRQFDGAVRANEALARSLNVPAVRLLQDYGVEPFYDFLKKAGVSTLNHPPEHYGLSLILGGSEATLWDLAGIYASMARILRTYEEHDGFYEANPFVPLNYVALKNEKKQEAAQPVLHASSVYETFRALVEVKRPGEEEGWQMFASPRKIAWKTGTSFGFRDAWAIGVTRDYVVGVWAGNADGEGRSGLTGASAAAPVLFDIFGILPQSRWFLHPADEYKETVVCSESGYLPSQFCEHTDTVQLPWNLNIKICPYHRLVHLDQTENYQVTAQCENPSMMVHKNWFVLPPVMEYYYKNKNPFYHSLPPFKPGCAPEGDMMELIYPHDLNRIFLPVQLDGSPGEVLFEAAHRDINAVVFWYIDDFFAGTTTGKHQLPVSPGPGWHTLVLTDENGNQLAKRFFADSRK